MDQHVLQSILQDTVHSTTVDYQREHIVAPFDPIYIHQQILYILLVQRYLIQIQYQIRKNPNFSSLILMNAHTELYRFYEQFFLALNFAMIRSIKPGTVQ